MSDEPNWEPEIHYPRLTDSLIEEGGGKQAKTLFTDLMAGRWSIYADGFYIEAGIDMEWDARDFDAEFRAEMESYY